jgi:hypothetical protein
MINQDNSVKDDLLSTTWIGEVVDIEDPLKIGRVKIKVYGKFDTIPTEDMPWAYPGNNNSGGSPSGGGFFSVPKLGSVVSVKFDNGNIYHPEYFFNQKISDEVKSEIEGSYPNAHVIVFDTVTEGSLKIFFTEQKGLMLDYKETQINVKPDKSIDIHTASGKSKIELLDDGKLNITNATDITVKCDTKISITSANETTIKCDKLIIDHASTIELGKGATEKVILGDKFMTLFNSHTHIGNVGAPTSPPIKPMTPAELSQKKVVVK